MPTVKQEMSDDQRRRELLYGLRRTQEDKVVIDVSHLIQAVGLDEAETLVEDLAELQEAVTTPYSSRERIVRHGYCVVNRNLAVEALERKTVELNKALIDKVIKKSN